MMMRIRTLFLKTVWLSELGRGKVVARGWGMVPEIMMMFTFFAVNLDFRLKIHEMIIFIIAAYLISIWLGHLYVKFKLLEIETEFANKQNPMLKRIEEKLI